MSKKTFILIVAVILLLIIGAGFYLFSSKRLSFPKRVGINLNPSSNLEKGYDDKNPTSNLEKDTRKSTSGCAYCDDLTGESLTNCKTAVGCP